MQRLLLSAFLLLSAGWAGAQTIQITTGTGTCTYPTGPVKSDPNTPGQLLATATGAGSGAGCIPAGTTGGPSFGPAAPLAPATVTLGSAGGAATFTFTAVNATQCTGAITGTAVGIFTGGTANATICSSAGACSGQQTVSTTFSTNASTTTDLTGTVAVTCTNGALQSVSSAVVTVTRTGVVVGGCSNPIQVPNSAGGVFTQWTGQQAVSILGTPSPRMADISSFDAIWGTWPGQAGLIVYPTLPNNKYIAAAFKSNNSFITNAPSNQYGEYYSSETDHSVPISMTISTACGDFSNPATNQNSTVVPGCYANVIPTSSYLAWTKSGSCKLVDGQQYYLNIINANISNVGANGTGTATSTYDGNNSFCRQTAGACTDPIEVILGP